MCLRFVAVVGLSTMLPDQARERAYPAVISADRMETSPAGKTLPLRLARCPMAAASTRHVAANGWGVGAGMSARLQHAAAWHQLLLLLLLQLLLPAACR